MPFSVKLHVGPFSGKTQFLQITHVLVSVFEESIFLSVGELALVVQMQETVGLTGCTGFNF